MLHHSPRHPGHHSAVAILSLALHSQAQHGPATANIPLLGPAVRLLLAHYDLKSEGLTASGPKKNIIKSDVLGHIKAKKLSPVKPNVQTPKLDLHIENDLITKPGLPLVHKLPQQEQHTHLDIPLSNMRQTIAKRLSQSKNSIPHAYASATIPADSLSQLRKTLSERAELKLSLNDFIIKACAMALRSVPEVNVQWRDDSVQRISSVDVSVAVATPTGLITPILFGADHLSVAQLSGQLRELAGRAREGRLRPEEFQGGTFTISNLGMFGSVSNFTAIINPPQAAILAVGGVERHCEPDGEEPRLVSQFGVTLCYDARAIDELNARRFLDSVRLGLSAPETLLSGMEHLLAEDESASIEGGEDLLLEPEIDVEDDEELAKLLLR